jgi:hypothetical protein
MSPVRRSGRAAAIPAASAAAAVPISLAFQYQDHYRLRGWPGTLELDLTALAGAVTAKPATVRRS